MSDAVTVAIVASIPSSLAVVIGLLNRKSVAGKNGLSAEVRANTTKIEESRRWMEKHDMDHLIDAHEERRNMERRLEQLEEREK